MSAATAKHQLIRNALISTGGMQEAHMFEQVAPQDTEEIYADKAYDTKLNQALAAQALNPKLHPEGGRIISSSAIGEDHRRNHKKGLD